MAEGSAKGKKAPKKKAKAADEGVLASLPATRPNRLGRRRDGADAPKPQPPAKPKAAAKLKASAQPKAAAKPKAAASKPAAAAKPKATAKPEAATAKPKAATPKPTPPASPTSPTSPSLAPEQPAHKTFTRTEADPVAEAATQESAAAATRQPVESAPKPAAKKDTGRKPRTQRGTPNPAPRDRSGEGGPPPVRPGAPALKPDADAEDRGPAPDDAPSGTELVTTVVKAAGELAQIGLTVGGQVLKRAVDRLPKP